MNMNPLRLLLLTIALAACAARAAEPPLMLIERSKAAIRVDPESSRRLAQEALQALARAPDPNLQVRAHLLLCDYYSERDPAAAKRHIEQAQDLLPQSTRHGLRAGLLSCGGEMAEVAGDNVQAMALYQQAVTVAEGAGEQELLADALFQRGYLRGLQGEFANGLADLGQAIAIYERLGLPQQAQTSVNGVAILYNRMGDYRQARTYFEATLKTQKKAGLTRELIVTHHNLGRVLENLKEWDAAQRAFETVLALSRELSYPRGEAYALRGLASVRNARGAPADAMTLLDRAAQLQRSTPDERLRAQILLQRGIALRAQQRPGESVGVLQQALQVFTKADSMAELGATHDELARSLTVLGDWKAAYEHQLKFQVTRDSLLQRQLDQRFATLRVEFDTAAKDKENALLQREKDASVRALAQEKRANRLQAAVLGLLVLLAFVLATLAWRQRRTTQAMQTLALTDELTGLPNRRDVLARLETLLAAPDRGCALLIVDIDHFKSINDAHGHLVGDDILRAVARALRDGASEPIAMGRLGGEEFVVVQPDGDEVSGRQLAERLIARVRALDLGHLLPGRRVTVSIGLTICAAGDTVTQMLRRADEALYVAKAGGRDRVVTRVPLPETVGFEPTHVTGTA